MGEVACDVDGMAEGVDMGKGNVKIAGKIAYDIKIKGMSKSVGEIMDATICRGASSCKNYLFS